jgi:hypothetical protein
MKVQSIDEASVDAMMAAPFNPPIISGTYTTEMFSEEYWNVHEKVKIALSALGKHDWCGDGDFTMNDEGGLARSLGIELSTTRMWNPRFLRMLQEELRNCPSPYRVFVTHSVLDEALFFLLVTADEVFGCSDKPEVLCWFDCGPS